MGRNQDDCKTTFRNMKERGVSGEFSAAENMDILLQINTMCRHQLQESRNLDIKEVSWQSIATTLGGKRTALDYLRHWNILKRQIMISSWQFKLNSGACDNNYTVWYDICTGSFSRVDATSSANHNPNPNTLPIHLEKDGEVACSVTARLFNGKDAINPYPNPTPNMSTTASGSDGESNNAFAADATATTTNTTTTTAISGKSGERSKKKSSKKRTLGSLGSTLGSLGSIADIAPGTGSAPDGAGAGANLVTGGQLVVEDSSLITGKKRIRNMGSKGLVDCLLVMNPASIAEIDWNTIDRRYLNNVGSSIRIWNDLNGNLKRELAKHETDSLRDKLVYIRSLL